MSRTSTARNKVSQRSGTARWFCVLLALCLLTAGSVDAADQKAAEKQPAAAAAQAASGTAAGADASAEQAAPSYRITDVTPEILENGLRLRISGTQEPAYTVYEMFNPARVVVDVASSVEYTQKIDVPENNFATLRTSFISEGRAGEPSITHFEFTLKGTHPYAVTREGNDVVVLVGSDRTEPAARDKAKQEAGMATTVYDLDVQTRPDKTVVIIQADGRLEYSHDVLPKRGALPPRLYIDLKNVKGRKLLKEQQVGTSLARLRVGKHNSGLRVVFDSSMDTLFQYNIDQQESGRLVVTIPETGQPTAAAKQQSPAATPVAAARQIQDNFTFSGYNRDRITVDFYKIDLHNVFRLFREISGMNIIVDEGVNGTLTLALDNVPWDFALDVILNLKGLKKEERFNTIVITDKGKEFNWPKRAEDNLSFQADEGLAMTEAIVIQKKLNIPPEQVVAKEKIRQGAEHEGKEEYEDAVKLYEEALESWPKDDVLANRIAGIYLVQLRQNAKAVYYAKKALSINKKNQGAALNAAIGLANMKRAREAARYFEKAVSGKKPKPEALLSYAVFCEEHGKYATAVRMLEKHDALYGENLGSMISEARIYDKMGQRAKATAKYKAILLSGFQVPPDLQKYIRTRVGSAAAKAPATTK